MNMPPPSDTDTTPIKNALNCNKMLEILRKHFLEFKEDLELVEVSITNVSYQSAHSCTVLYHLKVRKQGSEAISTQLLTGRILEPEESPVFPSEEVVNRFREDKRFVFRTPFIYLPHLKLLLQSFPLDSTLTWLPDAFDPKTMKLQLSQFCTDKKTKVKKVRSKVLSYQPDMRATFSYDVTCRSKDTGETSLRSLIGKIHIHKDPSRLFASSWAISQAAKGSLNMPQPVGYLFPYRLFLQEKIEGKRLGNIVDSPLLLEIMKETAKQLAILHRLSIPLVSCRRPQVEAEFVKRWAKLLIEVCPEMAARIENLSGRITSSLLVRAKMAGTVHGDFQNTNALVNETKVTLIDLDEVALGDPLSDVGRLLSSMRIPALRQFGKLNALKEAQEAFLSAYLRETGEDERRARLFEAGSLIVSAGSTFRQQRPNWREEVPLLLDKAEQAFKQSETSEPITVPIDIESSYPALPFEERISWALDPTYMQAVLQPAIHKAYNALITSCQILTKYDTNARCRIRYKLQGKQTTEKWSGKFQAITWKKHTGRNLWFRLNELNDSLKDEPDAPLLPRPVAYLPYFPLIVLELKQGKKLSALLPTPKGLAVSEKMARALASFHKAKAKFNRARPVEEEFLKFSKRLKHMQITDTLISSKITSLFHSLEENILSLPQIATPVLRKLRPQRIFYHENRIAFTEFDWLTYSHPFMDAANFLAQLSLLRLSSKQPEAIEQAADCFRSTYASALQAGAHGLKFFEAFSLLRMACSHFQHAKPVIAEKLLTTAQERIQHNA